MTGPLLPAAPRAAMPDDAFLERLGDINVNDLMRRAVAQQNLDLARARAVAEAAYRIAQSADGQAVIQHLLDGTLRAPVILEGASRDVAFDQALRREGANGLMWTILRLIDEGGKPPISQQKGPT